MGLKKKDIVILESSCKICEFVILNFQLLVNNFRNETFLQDNFGLFFWTKISKKFQNIRIMVEFCYSSLSKLLSIFLN